MSTPEKFWDSASKNYDNTEKRFEYIHCKSRENTKKFLKEDNIVLDYGCGTGTSSCEFAKYVKTIHAIDISGKMIEIAKEKSIVNKIKNVDFTQADIFNKTYKKESFDVILAFNMLHTVPNPTDVLKRINELLKTNGVFISVTPCLQDKMSFLTSMQIQLVRILCKLKIIPIPIRRLKSTDLDKLLELGDFHCIEKEMIYKDASSYFIVAKKKNNEWKAHRV